MSTAVLMQGAIVATNGQALPTDAVGRTNTSSPVTVFASGVASTGRASPMVTMTSGSATAVLTNGAMHLSGGSDSEPAMWQSRQYMPYVPGLARTAYFTCQLRVAGSAGDARAGLMDDAGVCWTVRTVGGTSLLLVCLISAGGAISNTAQSSFNLNTLTAVSYTGADGTVTVKPFDISVPQTYVIDMSWVGSSAVVKYGVMVQNQLLWAHVATYTERALPATLPVRYSVQDSTQLYAYSSAVVLQGSGASSCAELLDAAGTTMSYTSDLIPSTVITGSTPQPALYMVPTALGKASLVRLTGVAAAVGAASTVFAVSVYVRSGVVGASALIDVSDLVSVKTGSSSDTFIYNPSSDLCVFTGMFSSTLPFTPLDVALGSSIQASGGSIADTVIVVLYTPGGETVNTWARVSVTWSQQS